MYIVNFKEEAWLFDTLERAKKIAKLLFLRYHSKIRVTIKEYGTHNFILEHGKSYLTSRHKDVVQREFQHNIAMSIDDTAYMGTKGVSRLSFVKKVFKKKPKRTAEQHALKIKEYEKKARLCLDLWH